MTDLAYGDILAGIKDELKRIADNLEKIASCTNRGQFITAEAV